MKGWLNNMILGFFIGVIFMAVMCNSDDQSNELKQLKQEKKDLEVENEKLVMQIDSLDSLLKITPVEPAPQIITKIITKYEKDFHHIDNANADESFSILSEWLSSNDSL